MMDGSVVAARRGTVPRLVEDGDREVRPEARIPAMQKEGRPAFGGLRAARRVMVYGRIPRL